MGEGRGRKNLLTEIITESLFTINTTIDYRKINFYSLLCLLAHSLIHPTMLEADIAQLNNYHIIQYHYYTVEVFLNLKVVLMPKIHRKATPATITNIKHM